MRRNKSLNRGAGSQGVGGWPREDGGTDVAVLLRQNAGRRIQRGAAPVFEWSGYQTRFKPTIYEGQIAVCSHDLQQHINKAWGENHALVSPRQHPVAARLSREGWVFSTLAEPVVAHDGSAWRNAGAGCLIEINPPSLNGLDDVPASLDSRNEGGKWTRNAVEPATIII
jgi:hypothetical protein